MGLIREPKGIDFIIEGRPLSEIEKKAISNFIKSEKKKADNKVKNIRTKSLVTA